MASSKYAVVETLYYIQTLYCIHPLSFGFIE
jgi:hypothetical protein